MSLPRARPGPRPPGPSWHGAATRGPGGRSAAPLPASAGPPPPSLLAVGSQRGGRLLPTHVRPPAARLRGRLQATTPSRVRTPHGRGRGRRGAEGGACDPGQAAPAPSSSVWAVSPGPRLPTPPSRGRVAGAAPSKPIGLRAVLGFFSCFKNRAHWGDVTSRDSFVSCASP